MLSRLPAQAGLLRVAGVRLRSATWDRLWADGLRGLALRVGMVALALAAGREHVLRGDSQRALLVLALLGALLAAPLARYAAAWFSFALLRAQADDIGLPGRGPTAAAIDRWLGGVTPTEWLQQRLYVPGAYGWIDYAAIWVHSSYYVLPHVAAVAFWWRGRRSTDVRRITSFGLYMRGTLALMVIGLLLYAALPTAPPWLEATREDEMRVHRITRAGNGGTTRDPDQVYTFFTDPNPVAAMPSLHEAFTVLLAWTLWRERRRLGIAGGLYALAMGFALVYLGEHYLVDVVCGALIAGVVILVLDRWSRAQEAAAQS